VKWLHSTANVHPIWSPNFMESSPNDLILYVSASFSIIFFLIIYTSQFSKAITKLLARLRNKSWLPSRNTPSTFNAAKMLLTILPTIAIFFTALTALSALLDFATILFFWLCDNKNAIDMTRSKRYSQIALLSLIAACWQLLILNWAKLPFWNCPAF